MAKRGRPIGQMTTRRQQVLECIGDRSVNGEKPRWAEIARRCGLHSYNDARRIARDLERMGRINPLVTSG